MRAFRQFSTSVRVRHELAEIAEGVRYALHSSAVFADGEVPLGEEVERCVEVEGVGLPVAKEPDLQGELGLSSASPSSTMSCSLTLTVSVPMRHKRMSIWTYDGGSGETGSTRTWSLRMLR